MQRQATVDATSGMTAAQLARAMQYMSPEDARELVMASMQIGTKPQQPDGSMPAQHSSAASQPASAPEYQNASHRAPLHSRLSYSICRVLLLTASAETGMLRLQPGSVLRQRCNHSVLSTEW
jgi:hypothetical protein